MAKHLTPIVAFLLFCGSFLLCYYHAAPSVTFHDSGEFALAATCGGLVHPPGAPTWSLLATLFVKLAGFQDPARGTNLFSAFMSSLTLALFFLLCSQAIGAAVTGIRTVDRVLAALVGPAIMLHSGAWLEQSFTTEQYTLLTAMLVGFLLIVARVESRSQANLLYIFAGLMWGLAIGNHPSQLCLAAPLALHFAVLVRKLRGRQTLARIALLASGSLAGLLVFLWLPLRALRPALLDWVRATSVDRFMWAVRRELWPARPWYDAPSGFTREWVLTYDFIGELGIFGFILALLGIIVFVRRAKLTVLWYFPIVVTVYAFGMYWAHLKQQSISINYMRLYGVRDWHLPVYLLGSWFAALATATAAKHSLLQRKPRYSALVIPGFLVCIIAVSVPVIRESSLRNFKAPADYIHDLMATLPKDAIVVLKEDNTSNMLAYHTCRTGRQVETQRVYYGILDQSAIRSSEPRTTLSQQLKLKLFTTVRNPATQPLYLPPLSDDEILSRPVFVDYMDRPTALGPYLLPAGFLFEVTDTPTTPGQILEAERRCRQQHPEIFRLPGRKPNHLELEARSYAHLHRADYFHERKMWQLAVEEYKRSLAWYSHKAIAWFGLALCLQRTNASPDEIKGAYQNAIDLEPTILNARMNLAILAMSQQDFRGAARLLQDELKLNPRNTTATLYLEQATSRSR